MHNLENPCGTRFVTLPVGIRSDGKVVAVGRNKSGECDISDWSDISAVVAIASLTG
jgi:hypothetical protein